MTGQKPEAAELSRMRIRRFPGPGAFSLVELLAVIGIISILIALLAPSLNGFSSTAGRRGAVNIVMNTLDHARVAALETGADVQVFFWRREHPEQDALKVRRKTESGEWEEITRWIKLPKGVLLHRPDSGLNIFQEALEQEEIAGLSGDPPISSLGLIEFTPSGTVRVPREAENLMVILTEGTRATESVVSRRKEENGGFEIISVARYTGRPALEISEIPRG